MPLLSHPVVRSLHPRGWLFVGKLEAYAEDVAKLIAKLGFAPSWSARLTNASLLSTNFAKKYPRDTGNNTRYGVATSTALRAFRTDEATRSTVCHLLLIEHSCIDPLFSTERRYALPQECRKEALELDVRKLRAQL